MQKVPEKINFLEAPDFPPVETLHDFDWRKTEPLKFRPFKPKYHLTMGEFLLGGSTGCVHLD